MDHRHVNQLVTDGSKHTWFGAWWSICIPVRALANIQLTALLYKYAWWLSNPVHPHYISPCAILSRTIELFDYEGLVGCLTKTDCMRIVHADLSERQYGQIRLQVTA